MNDPIFEEEQRHLTDTYAKLTAIERETHEKLRGTLDEARKEMKDMQDEMSFDFASNDVQVETAAEYESMNAVIDAYNRLDEANARRWKAAKQLLDQPYFAKVVLQFKPNAPAREVYLGSAGMAGDDCRPFIVDWRSPIAETYYNQENGRTSYKVDDRTIEADLLLRRQFDIDRDVLNAYFDTTVAIEDPLLLQALGHEHSEKLKAITATIQKEQNQVVRHDDVPALVVNGIAGSGKTSVLLQRIAFLFYKERETLHADDVYLFTPNPVFSTYIDNVLPDMGEANPNIVTWDSFIAGLPIEGLANRNTGKRASMDVLRALDHALPTLAFEPADFNAVEYDGYCLMKASQVERVAAQFAREQAGPRLAALISDEIAERLEAKLKSLVGNADIQDAVYDLDVEERVRLFGSTEIPLGDDEFRACCKAYVEDRFKGVFDTLDDAPWLNVERVARRILGHANLNAVEFLYAKILLAGIGMPDVRYVMVDEAQDYTQAQLAVLARFFRRAHFLLLGDEHQAIHEETATFPQIRTLFERARGQVDECRLLTSYRSTPEITQLFCSLLSADERIKTSSVQREGCAPTIRAFSDTDAYLEALRAEVREARDRTGLTAIVAADWGRVKWLEKQLGSDVLVMREDVALPQSGVVMLDIALAKGLEFDRVIVPDAQAQVYPESEIARCRLYTAISRATHEVHILAQGELTPLLG